MTLHTTNSLSFQEKINKTDKHHQLLIWPDNLLKGYIWRKAILAFSSKGHSQRDICWFSLNRPMIYPHSFPVDLFLVHFKSPKDLFWFLSVKGNYRHLLVQFKSTNGLSWFFPVDIFSGSDKSLQDLFWFFRDLCWFSLNQ